MAENEIIDSLKRYIYDAAHKLGHTSKHLIPDGRIPTPEEFVTQLYQLRSRFNVNPSNGAVFREFHFQDSCRLNDGVVTSGLALSETFDKQKWLEAARAVDHLLNELRPQREKPAELVVIEGGVIYGEFRVDLQGKPLRCINQLLCSQLKRISATDLRRAVWNDDICISDASIKNTISDARKALRKLAQKAGLSVPNPIPCVDRGEALAWSLAFPE